MMNLNMHKKSNYPPNIIKWITLTIEKRLSNISSYKKIFDEATEYNTLNRMEPPTKKTKKQKEK